MPPAEPAPAPDPVPETLYPIKVKGEDQKVTLAELTKLAELSGGAQQSMAAAADVRKKNEKAVALFDAMARLKAGDMTAVDSVASLLEIPDSQVGAVKGAIDQAAQTLQGGPPAASADGVIGEDDLTPELQAKLAAGDKARQEAEALKVAADGQALRTTIEKEIGEKVDIDPIFGKMEESDKTEVKSRVFDEVQRLVMAEGMAWPDVLTVALPKVRAFVERISNRGNRQALDAAGNPAAGPATVLTPTTQVEVPLERPPLTDNVGTKAYLGQRIRDIMGGSKT